MKYINEAIYRAAKSYPGGARALAQAIGAQPGTFTNKCNPKVETHVLNIEELVKVVQATGDHDIIKEFAQHFGYICYGVEPADEAIGDSQLLDAWASWELERAETVAVIKTALDDGEISEKELAHIRKEMFEDFQIELALLGRLEQLLSPQ